MSETEKNADSGVSRTLADAIRQETARVRELSKAYVEIGPAGRFALTMIELDLRAADKAMVEGDVIAMLRVLESLKGYKE